MTQFPTDQDVAEARAVSARLLALEPREAQALIFRWVEGRPCEELYGISPDALAVKELRALRAYLGQDALPAGEELGRARALDGPELALAQSLERLGPLIRQALDEAARGEDTSPARRRQDQLRRAAVVAILALTALMYWRSKT